MPFNTARPPFFVALPPGTSIKTEVHIPKHPMYALVELAGYMLEFRDGGPFFVPFYFESGGMMYLPDHAFSLQAINPYELPEAKQYE